MVCVFARSDHVARAALIRNVGSPLRSFLPSTPRRSPGLAWPGVAWPSIPSPYSPACPIPPCCFQLAVVVPLRLELICCSYGLQQPLTPKEPAFSLMCGSIPRIAYPIAPTSFCESPVTIRLSANEAFVCVPLRRSCALHTAVPWQVHRVQRLGAAAVGAVASELRKRHRRAEYNALRVPRGSAVSSQRPLERSLLRLQRSPLPSTPYIFLQSLPPSFSLALFDEQAWTEYQVEGFLKISMATQRCPPGASASFPPPPGPLQSDAHHDLPPLQPDSPRRGPLPHAPP